MSIAAERDRLGRLRTIVSLLLCMLFARVLAGIVFQYRSYFPADFDSAFLTGRQSYFFGVYGVAFYVHIVSGPVAIVLGSALMWSGLRTRLSGVHHWLGKLQIVLILVAVVPSGLIMATRAYTGPIAGLGFVSLALATAGSAVATACFARSHQIGQHRQWATRCFILLCSPLLLRLTSGAVIVTQLESQLTYRLSAWLCWLVPLAVHEIWRYRQLIPFRKQENATAMVSTE